MADRQRPKMKGAVHDLCSVCRDPSGKKATSFGLSVTRLYLDCNLLLVCDGVSDRTKNVYHPLLLLTQSTVYCRLHCGDRGAIPLRQARKVCWAKPSRTLVQQRCRIPQSDAMMVSMIGYACSVASM